MKPRESFGSADMMRIDLDKAPTLTLAGENGQQVLSLRDYIDEAYGVAGFLREHFGGDQNQIVGLVFPTSRKLFVQWFGVILAGMEPCILHYPTQKTIRNYYETSLAASVRALDAISPT